MLIHEIGFIVFSGVLQCWGVDGLACPSKSQQLELYKAPAKNSKSMKLSSIDLKNFSPEEVQYEEVGLPVYQEKSGGWYQLRNLKGETYWLNVPQSLKTFPSPKGSGPALTYEPIAEILGSALINPHEKF